MTVRPLWIILYLSMISFTGTARGHEADQLLDMNLEQLVASEVTSVSRKSQSILAAPAAVYSITQEDIRRSGARSIPDILRMAPGLQVYKLNNHTWSVSARGNSSIFSNKILILIDGRSIYSPFIGGVHWENQDMLLADIERIEVIRGPGAALWGANSVNGVIDIITRSARVTQGTYAEVGAGDLEKGFGAIRHGGQIGDDISYRAYVKQFEQGAQDDLGSTLAAREQYLNASAEDNRRMKQAGFRVDWDKGALDTFMFKGDIYRGETYVPATAFDSGIVNSFITLPVFHPFDTRQLGGNTHWRWTRTLEDNSEAVLQFWYDRYEADSYVLDEDRNSWDIDFQYSFDLSSATSIIWGLGYRYVDDDFHSHTISEYDSMVVTPNHWDTELYSAYMQGEFTLVPTKWHLTLSGRIEHNDITGYELQPNARLIYTPDAFQSFWAAVSKAVRTPTMAETGIDIINPGRQYNRNDSLDSEKLIALEVGYKRQFNDKLSMDSTLFLNRFDGLSGQVDLGACADFLTASQPAVALPTCERTTLENLLDGYAYGLELSMDWKVKQNWLLKVAYSHLQQDMQANRSDAIAKNSEKTQEETSAQNSLSLMSRHNLPNGFELDIWVRYSDSLSAPDISLPSLTTMDVRIAKRFGNMELSITGQNLLDSSHPEFVDVLSGQITTEVPRSIYGKISWDF